MYLELDGSYGEGGGQILRSSLSMAALLNKPIRIHNIRAGRKKPGLQAQHLTCVTAAAAISGADVEGAEVNSQKLAFKPRALQSGNFQFDVSDVYASAGSMPLIFQTLLPSLCFANSRSQISLFGGTHVPWSPPFHYIDLVFLPIVRAMGVKANVKLLKAGWYPRGGGNIAAEIEPGERLKPIDLREAGKLERIYCVSGSSNLPAHIAQRQADHAAAILKSAGFKPEVEILQLSSPGQGTIVFILAEFENSRAGFTELGAIGKKAEKVAQECCAKFLEFMRMQAGCAIECHLGDQLIIYMALAQGRSCFTTASISQHLLTNIWVVEQFLPVKFQLKGQLGEPGEVCVEGIDR